MVREKDVTLSLRFLFRFQQRRSRRRAEGKRVQQTGPQDQR